MLRETYRGTVYPWQCDHMGHMNVMWYVGKFDEATWHLFHAIGITPSFLRNERRAMAAVDQHIRYRRELHAGAVVSVRSAFVEIRDKVLKFVHEMKNEETGETAALCALTGVHIDAQTRRSCPLPEEIVQRGRELVTTYQFPER
jgi:acyl-CoA thioester hydrolase